MPMFKSNYLNWSEPKRAVVIFLAVSLMAIFLWQLGEIDDSTDPDNAWRIIVMLICNLLIPLLLIIRAFKPNSYYRITSKTVYEVQKSAFFSGRKMIMFR